MTKNDIPIPANQKQLDAATKRVAEQFPWELQLHTSRYGLYIGLMKGPRQFIEYCKKPNFIESCLGITMEFKFKRVIKKLRGECKGHETKIDWDATLSNGLKRWDEEKKKNNSFVNDMPTAFISEPKEKDLKISVTDSLTPDRYEYIVVSDIVGDSVGIILQSYDFTLKELTIKKKTMRVDRKQFIRETERFLNLIKGNNNED